MFQKISVPSRFKLIPILTMMAFFYLAIPLGATTYVSGSILSDTTWSKSGSPYYVTGDVVVYHGYTLIIEPGVRVEVGEDLKIQVRGNLYAVGTKTQRIIFDRKDSDQWHGFDIQKGAKIALAFVDLYDAFLAINDYAGIDISDCGFRNNHMVVTGSLTLGLKTTIERCTFNNNVFAVVGQHRYVVHNTFTNHQIALEEISISDIICNTISNNNTAIRSGQSIISYNNISSNDVGVEHYEYDSKMTVQYNTITNNGIGIYSYKSQNFLFYPINNNNIYNNTTYNAQVSTYDADFSNNWWGTVDSNSISATIWDAYDSAGLGIATYDPFLTTPVDINCSLPDASFGFSPLNPGNGQPVTFNASASTAPSGFKSYNWTFGDGTNGSGANINHSYATPGIYPVKLIVTDNNDKESLMWQSVVVTTAVALPPTAAYSYSPNSPQKGQSVIFDATDSSDIDGTITHYNWSFGDGSNGTGPVVNHVFTSNGSYTVTLTVTDNDGESDSISQTVTVSEASSESTLSVESSPENGASIMVSPNDKDGFGDGLTSFSRKYLTGTLVSITAPATHDGSRFLKWTIDGTENSSRNIQVRMDMNHTVCAIFETNEPHNYTVTIKANTGSGANISVSPEDIYGDGNGTTNFTRTFGEGTEITLTGAAYHDGKIFSKWKVDGVEKGSDAGLQITVNADTEVIAYYTATTVTGLFVNRSNMNFGAVLGGLHTPSQPLMITIGGSVTDWTAGSDVDWLTLSATHGSGTHGSGSAKVNVSAASSSLTAGEYTGTITIDAPGLNNAQKTVSVIFKVHEQNAKIEPFGRFATPIENANVAGSVAVTGWVVDNIGVVSVKLYREEAGQLAFIGDAIFVEGARPDVEAAYPEYPMNYAAGWGYMLLTNFLPNGGNGTFKLHVIASDVEGNRTTLGVRSINCNNAQAVKPFGALDAPDQGGIASGSSFINWGWVLTPLPNSIPTDGSTIDVWVNGTSLGHPVYNLFRNDIASLFPSYANSNGAVGYFILDTTDYADGVHTIQWTASDSADNTDGIGSRYFWVQNNSSSRVSHVSRLNGIGSNPQQNILDGLPRHLHLVPQDHSQPLEIKTGFNKNQSPRSVTTKKDEPYRLKLNPLGRVEISFNRVNATNKNWIQKAPMPNDHWYGFLMVGDEPRSLPIGSSLDVNRGIFYWQPGLCFLGEYQFIFIRKTASGEFWQKRLTIQIKPGTANR
jgi:PKD repeat protein